MARNARGQYLPGTGGNPAGRPREIVSLGAMIRRRTRSGTMLVEFALAILEGKPMTEQRVGPGGRVVTREVTPTLDQRLRALAWVCDRGFGKPIQTTDLNLAGFEGVDIRLLGSPRAAEKGEEG